MLLVYLADGFEEVEALTVVDVLRRAEINTKTVGVTGKMVTGAHGIPVEADIMVDEINWNEVTAMFFPGGMPGTKNLDECPVIKEKAVEFANAGKPVFAICAAPMILGKLGILKGKEAICYPSFETYLEGAKISEKNVCRDGNIITGEGPGAAADFAFEIVAYLKDADTAAQLKCDMRYER